MEGASDPVKLIDLPGQALEKVVEALAKVGIDLSVLALQLFLLVLVLAALVATMRWLIPDWRNVRVGPLVGVCAIALVAVGIVIGIVSQMLLPNRLIGRVVGPELAGATVELLDFRGQIVSTGGSVDTQTGEFIAYYRPAWSGRARTLRINSAACKPREEPIGRGRLARGAEAGWNFPCEKP